MMVVPDKDANTSLKFSYYAVGPQIPMYEQLYYQYFGEKDGAVKFYGAVGVSAFMLLMICIICICCWRPCCCPAEGSKVGTKMVVQGKYPDAIEMVDCEKSHQSNATARKQDELKLESFDNDHEMAEASRTGYSLNKMLAEARTEE
mmetsp:Transcript_17367/g.29207  ORF Transcript_17367/g.29207 Transcript_17367/m.29207 type:complete len:146 (+) Transcript_17367:605-1042(+)